MKVIETFPAHQEGEISKLSAYSGEQWTDSWGRQFLVTDCVSCVSQVITPSNPNCDLQTKAQLSVPPNKGTIKLFKKRHNVKLDQVLSELLKDGISVSLIPWHAVNEGCMWELKLKVYWMKIVFKAEFKDSLYHLFKTRQPEKCSALNSEV